MAPGQSHESSSQAEELSAIEVGSCGDKSAGLDTALALNWCEPNEIGKRPATTVFSPKFR